jgi:hypothetical protein
VHDDIEYFDGDGHYRIRDPRTGRFWPADMADRMGPGAGWVFPNRGSLNRTKEESPYSYSDFYIWREVSDPLKTEGIAADYSDRLLQWSREKWDRAWDAVGSKRFDQMTRDEVSRFISAYHGSPHEAVALSEGCNVSNGYPYWIIYYKKI